MGGCKTVPVISGKGRCIPIAKRSLEQVEEFALAVEMEFPIQNLQSLPGDGAYGAYSERISTFSMVTGRTGRLSRRVCTLLIASTTFRPSIV